MSVRNRVFMCVNDHRPASETEVSLLDSLNPKRNSARNILHRKSTQDVSTVAMFIPLEFNALLSSIIYQGLLS